MRLENERNSKVDYFASRSYWLESCRDDLTPRPMLSESKIADVAIMGAGFSGLWTAYYLLRQNPSLHIIILEKEIVGFGASGRNGGWCTPHLPISISQVITQYGVEIAKNLQLVMFDTIDEVGSVIDQEGIDADWVLGGSLEIALGDYAIPALEDSLLTFKKLGLEDQFEQLDKYQTERRIRISGARGSLLTKNSAVLNPGKLVRRLARILEQRGVEIYEQTEVVEIEEGNIQQAPKLVAKNGTITAKQAVVLAGEAYMSQLKKYHRNLIPMYSLITLTEPLTNEQWASIGWRGRETVGSTRLSIDYLQRTSDGRILFGGRGQPYRYGSKISDELDRHKETHELLQRMTKSWFPAISGVQFSHSWGGPLGITRDWTPNINFNKRSRVASAWGYAGQGVSVTNLAGRILSDLISEKESPITQLPIVQHQSKKWEVEPFRWLGTRYVQASLANIDKKAELTGKPPTGNTLAERLARY